MKTFNTTIFKSLFIFILIFSSCTTDDEDLTVDELSSPKTTITQETSSKSMMMPTINLSNHPYFPTSNWTGEFTWVNPTTLPFAFGSAYIEIQSIASGVPVQSVPVPYPAFGASTIMQMEHANLSFDGEVIVVSDVIITSTHSLNYRYIIINDEDPTDFVASPWTYDHVFVYPI